MENKVVDPFGFKGQAQDYEIERPRYPDVFLEKLLQQPIAYGNFVDIASGTGILFYEIAHKFTGTLAVNDRSKKLLDVAKEKLSTTSLDPSRVEFVESDAFDTHTHLSKPTKFDLVTIAQALHWVDPAKFCEYTINNLLAENGVFSVLGYFCDGFDYNFSEDSQFAKSGQQHYDKFYSTVLPHFDCDRESLDKGHSNFDFTKYFENFERFDHEVKVEIPLDRFVKYLGTYSAYNIYKSKFGSQADYEDPLQTLKTNIEKDLQEHYQKHGAQPKEKPLVMRMHFFMLLISKPKKL